MSETSGAVAYEARELARQAQRDIESHEAVCAERYGNINDKLNMLFKIIAWAGGTAFLVVMGLLTYLAKTQFENITALQQALAQQQRIPVSPPQVYIQPAPGSPPMGASVDKQTNTPQP